MADAKTKFVPPAEGGSYTAGSDGKSHVRKEFTKDHPEGNFARPEPEETKAAAPQPQPQSPTRGLAAAAAQSKE